MLNEAYQFWVRVMRWGGCLSEKEDDSHQTSLRLGLYEMRKKSRTGLGFLNTQKSASSFGPSQTVCQQISKRCRAQSNSQSSITELDTMGAQIKLPSPNQITELDTTGVQIKLLHPI